MGSVQDFHLVTAAENLLKNAKKLAAATAPGVDDNEPELRRCVASTAKKIAFMTAPRVDVVKEDWVTLAEVGAWNIFIEWEAFDFIPLNGYISIVDLARELDAQESLVARIANLLLATGKLLPGPPVASCSSTPPQSPYANITIRHSRISPLYMTSHPVSPLCTVAVGNAMRPFARWPDYFDIYGRCEPPEQRFTPFSFAWDCPDLEPWEVKAEYPDYASAFARSMQSKEMVGGDTVLVGEEAVYDMAWVGEEAKVFCNYKPWENWTPTLVDVGGGLGQLLQDVLRDVDGLRPEQCLLQDRREVIDKAKDNRDGVLAKVVMMEQDFHEEQPLKGGLVYILRRILLDYPDEASVNILQHLADALPDDNPKARVLIMEERLLEVPTTQNCLVDVVMLNLGGKLRNEAMFRELATAAGLRVVGFHVSHRTSNCVVECAKA
ncbi:uncharacterized protein C8A04DRAFT_39668 [Dichotomopilus funicola]|uniref:O-methyltransferase C-terminal domain-containing protein n=1 Tax=Dichotomopilus funicola TaxID=1934379 RepID=A0AAN6UXC1_9PEZI|nr:hypothetical protein C8A04DRAFT_39668 [Dichotomopilus funicola]